MSRATVLRAVAKGRIQPAMVTPGGHRRFLLQDIAALGGRLRDHGCDPQLVRSSEAARLLGVSQQTLNRAVREGRLKPAVVTPGGHRRFAAAEIAVPLEGAHNGAASI